MKTIQMLMRLVKSHLNTRAWKRKCGRVMENCMGGGHSYFNGLGSKITSKLYCIVNLLDQAHLT
jgi:hypothetical protein